MTSPLVYRGYYRVIEGLYRYSTDSTVIVNRVWASGAPLVLLNPECTSFLAFYEDLFDPKGSCNYIVHTWAPK